MFVPNTAVQKCLLRSMHSAVLSFNIPPLLWKDSGIACHFPPSLSSILYYRISPLHYITLTQGLTPINAAPKTVPPTAWCFNIEPYCDAQPPHRPTCFLSFLRWTMHVHKIPPPSPKTSSSGKYFFLGLQISLQVLQLWQCSFLHEITPILYFRKKLCYSVCHHI